MPLPGKKKKDLPQEAGLLKGAIFLRLVTLNFFQASLLEAWVLAAPVLLMDSSILSCGRQEAFPSPGELQARPPRPGMGSGRACPVPHV